MINNNNYYPNFFYSKRSNFLIKLGGEKRQELFNRLTYLAESWGGKDNGFGLAECCVNGSNPVSSMFVARFVIEPSGFGCIHGEKKCRIWETPSQAKI